MMKRNEQESLFVYGTLRCTEIMAAITGHRYPAQAATLEHYVALRVKDETYPGIVEAPGASVEGCVYRQLDTAALAALDRFEGEMYERRSVRVRLEDNYYKNVFAYIVKDEHKGHLDKRVWDYRSFLKESKEAFISKHIDIKNVSSCLAHCREQKW